MFHQFPKEILGLIYLYLEDSFVASERRAFLKISKEVYQIIRTFYHQFQFNYYYSALFLIDERFRRFIQNRLASPYHQLLLKYKNLEDHILAKRLWDRTILSFHTFNIHYSSKLTNLSLLPRNLQVLKLHSCPYVSIFPSDFSDFPLQRLEISENYILTSANEFRNIPFLILHNCKELIDISLLGIQGKQQFLQLSYCPKISNIDHLRGIPNLSIISCPKIQYYDNLINVTTLNLSNCQNLTNFQDLMIRNPSLKKLNLSFSNIEDTSILQNIYSLNLSYCGNIIDVSCLQNVKVLNLSHCSQLKDVSALGNCIDINISHSPCITNINALGKVRILDISFCRLITSVKALTHVKKLTISGSYNIKDLDVLKGLNTILTIFSTGHKPNKVLSSNVCYF
eukprot:gene10525-11461_t